MAVSTLFQHARMPTGVQDAVAEAVACVRGHKRAVGVGVGVAVGMWWVVRLRKRFFAWYNNEVNKMKSEDYMAIKKQLFAPLANHASRDPTQRTALRILEIGAGVGTNFTYFPDGCDVVVVDPNPYFGQYFDENRQRFPNINTHEIIVTTGERMDMIGSGSVDVVVVTMVLCSVSDIHKVLANIRRVLVPGGKFYFMEHILEWDLKLHWRRWLLQNLLTYSCFWPALFDGCCINRDPVPAIMRAGFSSVDRRRLYAPMPGWFFSIVSPHVTGVATN